MFRNNTDPEYREWQKEQESQNEGLCCQLHPVKESVSDMKYYTMDHEPCWSYYYNSTGYNSY